MEAGLDPKIRERNHAMIRVRSPRAAQRIMNAKTSVGFSLVETDEGVPSGALDGRALASKRRPMSEAEKFAGGYDPKQAAGACVLGFGMGHHLAALHERIGSKGVVICFEPDLGLLRAVLERVDHRAWLKKGRFLLATDPDDAAELLLPAVDGQDLHFGESRQVFVYRIVEAQTPLFDQHHDRSTGDGLGHGSHAEEGAI